jgi:hypothetical protein
MTRASERGTCGVGSVPVVVRSGAMPRWVRLVALFPGVIRLWKKPVRVCDRAVGYGCILGNKSLKAFELAKR